MPKRDWFTKVLAVVGTILVATPLLLPLVFGLATIGRAGGFRFDYLMPFEVYPVTLVGAALLVWSSLRGRTRRGAVAIAVGGMLGGVLLGAASATLTGIANSEETLETWRYVVTAGFGVLALVAQAALIVIGCLLMRELFATPADSPSR